jgi:hypothetical protein
MTRLTCRASAHAALLLTALLLWPARAAAQQAPAPAPPQPAPAPQQPLPPRYPYREGMPIPPGYHLEDRPRQGFLTAGYLVAGIPYAIGLMIAASADFANESGWLALPFAGPWMTIGRRDYACSGEDDPDQDPGDCWGDAVVAPLILDGIVQTLGGIFLMVGYTATKEYVVRDDMAYAILPSRVGSGYGMSLVGRL